MTEGMKESMPCDQVISRNNNAVCLRDELFEWAIINRALIHTHPHPAKTRSHSPTPTHTQMKKVTPSQKKVIPTHA